MSASPKSKRTPPSRRFEDYVLMKSVLPSNALFQIDKKRFTAWPDAAGVGNGLGNWTSGQLRWVDLGFTFNFSGVNYTKVAASEYGIAVLIDPSYSSPYSPPDDDKLEVDQLYNASVRSNSQIASSFGPTGQNNHVLIAAWHDQMNTGFADYQTVQAGSSAIPAQTAATMNKLIYGLDKPDNTTDWDASEHAVSYARAEDHQGKYFVIKWSVISGLTTSNYEMSRLKFEAAIFENGSIQLRYQSKGDLVGTLSYRPPYSGAAPSGTVGATMGIFANWSGWKFRDFSEGLGYRDDVRSKYVNGGYVYNSSYTDTGVNLNNDIGVAPYSCNLDPAVHWPGRRGMTAIYSFLPPVNRRTQNRTIVAVRDSASIMRNDVSLFDDRKTMICSGSSQVVQYPTMIPVNYRTSYNFEEAVAINQLYQSGSLEVTRSIGPGLVDSVFYDTLVDFGRKF